MSPKRLSSWNDCASRTAIVDFVEGITRPGSSDFVPPADRIATFDDDGTLWCERPLQVQFFFARSRLEQLAQADPSLRVREPFKTFLEHDMSKAPPHRTCCTLQRSCTRARRLTSLGISPSNGSLLPGIRRSRASSRS